MFCCLSSSGLSNFAPPATARRRPVQSSPSTRSHLPRQTQSQCQRVCKIDQPIHIPVCPCSTSLHSLHCTLAQCGRHIDYTSTPAQHDVTVDSPIYPLITAKHGHQTAALPHTAPSVPVRTNTPPQLRPPSGNRAQHAVSICAPATQPILVTTT